MLKAHLKIIKEDVNHRPSVVADQPGRSFLIAFASLTARQMAQAEDGCKDSAGQVVTRSECDAPFHMTSCAGYGRGIYMGFSVWDEGYDADEQGIVIGTDSAAVQPDQYGLISKIESGEIAGQVMYYGTCLYGLTIDAGTDTAEFNVEALFHNKSGGSININEVGIYAHGGPGSDSWPNLQQYCIIRDVLGATIALGDGEYVRVTYTISIAT